nr:immunoglobulin light chain junction region [Macaca mulatta]MOY09482.1 immunoglobulin light chain junction region [Macaca mulatta]
DYYCIIWHNNGWLF